MSKPWFSFGVTLTYQKAKALAESYSDKGNRWIIQKLRNHNCSEKIVCQVLNAIPYENKRAELAAAGKWETLSHKDIRVKIIQLAQYLKSHHFIADIAWEVAKEYGHMDHSNTIYEVD